MNPLTAETDSRAEPHRVWCVELDDAAEPTAHRHLVALEASGADGVRYRWTIVEVIAAIREGELFIVGEGEGEQAAVLEPSVCAVCRRATAITHPAAALDDVARCG